MSHEARYRFLDTSTLDDSGLTRGSLTCLAHVWFAGESSAAASSGDAGDEAGDQQAGEGFHGGTLQERAGYARMILARIAKAASLALR